VLSGIDTRDGCQARFEVVKKRVAVGTAIAGRPPHRSVQALLTHTALTSDAKRRIARWSMEARLLPPFPAPLGAPRPIPGTCVARSVSGACWTDRSSPRSAAFPPQPPPKVALPCSAGSQVLCPSATPPPRACPHYGIAPSRTGLPTAQARRRSPGSRACCFSACAGSPTTQDPDGACDGAPPDVAFPFCPQGRHPGEVFSQLDTRPTDASIYASAATSR
jgi:hypothetical protein